MIEDIKMIKTKVLQFMEQEVGKYGNGRMDVKQVGELADVIKDLAEAEYYCSIAEAMGGQDTQGYQQQRMGYPNQDGMASGYGTNSHNSQVSAIREMLSSADPETKMAIRNEIMRM